jgi:hypothetical protein
MGYEKREENAKEDQGYFLFARYSTLCINQTIFIDVGFRFNSGMG